MTDYSKIFLTENIDTAPYEPGRSIYSLGAVKLAVDPTIMFSGGVTRVPIKGRLYNIFSKGGQHMEGTGVTVKQKDGSKIYYYLKPVRPDDVAQVGHSPRQERTNLKAQSGLTNTGYAVVANRWSGEIFDGFLIAVGDKVVTLAWYDEDESIIPFEIHERWYTRDGMSHERRWMGWSSEDTARYTPILSGRGIPGDPDVLSDDSNEEPEPQPKENTMSERNIAALLRQDAHTVTIKYPGEEKGYTYVALTSLGLKGGDVVVVNNSPTKLLSGTNDNVLASMRLATIDTVHDGVQIEPNETQKYTWVIAKVPLEQFEALVAENAAIEKTVAENYKQRLQQSFRNTFLQGMPESALAALPAAVRGPVAAAPAAQADVSDAVPKNVVGS